MLHVLQYFMGTSIAALVGLIDLTRTQSLSEGPRVSGSSLPSGGGKGCKFRGRIYTTRCQLRGEHQLRRDTYSGFSYRCM